MPVILSTTINNFYKVANLKNADIIREFYQFMKNSCAGDKHINNNLKIVLNFTCLSDQNLSFKDVERSEIIQFLGSKIKPIEQDPDRRWITT